jgi:DNA repair protein RadC
MCSGHVEHHETEQCLHTARTILDTLGLVGLSQALCNQPETLLHFGLSDLQVERLRWAYELMARCSAAQRTNDQSIRSAEDAVYLIRPNMIALDHEQLHVLALDIKHRLVEYQRLYKGTVNSSTVRIAEILRVAVVRNCPNLIVSHNHPSGDPTPSQEDIEVTEQLVQAAKLMDIQVLDHLIIGRPGYTSLKARLSW